MTEVAKDSHPDFPLHHVGCPIIQGERVRRGADGGRPDDVPLHLNAFGRRERGRGPGDAARCAPQAGDERVPQLPGSPVQPFAEPMESLTVVQGALGFLVFALGFRFDGLVILIGKAVLGFLDLLVELLAELLAQFFIGKPPFPPHLELLLVPGLGPLCAGTRGGRAGSRLVAVLGAGRRFRQLVLWLLLEAPQGFEQGAPLIRSLPRSPLKRKRQGLTTGAPSTWRYAERCCSVGRRCLGNSCLPALGPPAPVPGCSHQPKALSWSANAKAGSPGSALWTPRVTNAFIHHASPCRLTGLTHYTADSFHIEGKQHAIDSSPPTGQKKPGLGCIHWANFQHWLTHMHAKWPKGQFLKAPEVQPLLALWLRFCCDDTIPAGCSEPQVSTLWLPLYILLNSVHLLRLPHLQCMRTGNARCDTLPRG